MFMHQKPISFNSTLNNFGGANEHFNSNNGIGKDQIALLVLTPRAHTLNIYVLS